MTWGPDGAALRQGATQDRDVSSKVVTLEPSARHGRPSRDVAHWHPAHPAIGGLSQPQLALGLA
ncbi:hypothetical protein GCM10009638_17700 [Luteococcus sanguinis]